MPRLSRYLLSTIAAVTILVAATGTTKLTITADNRSLFDPTDPRVHELQSFEDRFESNLYTLIAVLSPSDIRNDTTLIFSARWLADKIASELPGVLRIESLATIPRIGTGPAIALTPFIDSYCDEHKCSNELEMGIKDSRIARQFMGPAGKSLGTGIVVDIDRSDPHAIQKFAQALNRILDQHRVEFPSLGIAATGGPLMMNAFWDAANGDITGTAGLAFLVILLLLMAVTGSLRATSLLVLIALVSIAVSMGIAGWNGVVLNTATATTPLVIFTLVCASSMHIVVHFIRSISTGSAPQSAASAAVSANYTAMLLSAITTISGLLSLTTAGSPPLKDIGIYGSIGVAVGLGISLTFLPWSLGRYIARVEGQRLLQLQRLINTYAKFLERRTLHASSVAAVLVLCAAGVLRLDLDENHLEYFDEGTEFRIHTEAVSSIFSGPNHLEIVLTSNSLDGSTLSALSKLVDNLDANSLIGRSFCAGDLITEIAIGFTGEDNLTAFDANAVAQLYLMYQLSLSQEHQLGRWISEDLSSARCALTLRNSSSSEIRALEQDIYRLAESMNVNVRVTGENLPNAYLTKTSMSSMIMGIAASLLMTSCLLGIYFRHAVTSAVALVAVLAPVLCGFGAWGWIAGEIGLSTATIIAVTIGVAIDDAIHLIVRYFHGTRELSLSRSEATGYAVHRAGTAIITTTIVLLGGFAILGTSSFGLNQEFGISSAIIIASALLIDLTLLPKTLQLIRADQTAN